MADPTKLFPTEGKCLSLDVMMDYIHDRLSNKERNLVERHTLDCEFCSEAMDGLSLSVEDKARDIIGAVDEVNHLESQLLISASSHEPVEDFSFDESIDFSKKEFQLEEEGASPEMAASAPAPMRRKERASVGGAKTYALNDVPPKKNFDWRRMAAVITGAILLGAGLFYMTQQDWTKDKPVASTNKPGVELKVEDKSSVITDSIIAIAPSHKESLNAGQPNSDGNLVLEEQMNGNAPLSNKVEEVVPAKGAAGGIQEGEIVEERPQAAAAPQVQGADKRIEVSKDEDSYNYEFKNEAIKKDVNILSKAAKPEDSKRKAAARSTTDVVMMDSVSVVSGNAVPSSSFDKGLNLYTKGEYQKATKQLLDVKKSDANYEEARWYLAKSYAAIGEKEKAKMVFKELVEMKGKFKERAEEELKK